ncbi:HupE/UreJ family protein [Halodurantibacterium flavum]|uniref:HupE/UreJ family protein n=1 Tax=Halodurantibacterium flavum TaxID=1382802 RepID=A0ABW4SAA9_9RHOB
MKRLFLSAILTAAASPLWAHPGHDHADAGFGAGFSHPLHGADHILAMVAVGLWAASVGGRALWALPAAFVGAMVMGFGVALGGMTLPLVEPMILGSVIVLGLALALAMRLSLAASAAIVALFGVFHGFAHGQEMGAGGAAAFGAGFALATAMLHAGGVALGATLVRELEGRRGRLIMRGLGAGAVLGGVVLALG